MKNNAPESARHSSAPCNTRPRLPEESQGIDLAGR